MDNMFEMLKKEVEEERRKLYSDKFDIPTLEEQSLLNDKKAE